MKTIALLLLTECLVVGLAQAGSYDPMEDLVSTAKKEINAKEAIDQSKNRVMNDPRKEKVERGFWQFFQGKRGAKPGEACTAVYWQQDRMISIIGPGGGYHGALLVFVAVNPDSSFPRPDNPKDTQKVKVTLKQGTDAPATVTVLNSTIAEHSDQLLFAVPTIEAALAGMEDRLKFSIDHGGKKVFELEWHSGLAARDILKQCLKGETVDGKEVL